MNLDSIVMLNKPCGLSTKFVVVRGSIIYNSTSIDYANKQYIKFAPEDWLKYLY